MAFEIKRGYKNRLMNEDGSPKIELQDGCWYLTLDTAEVFVAITLDGILDLYKINEAPGINLDEFNDRFDSIETRLSALEEKSSDESELLFADKNTFPEVGESDKIYIAVDTNEMYIYKDGIYQLISGSSLDPSDISMINGGSASN